MRERGNVGNAKNCQVRTREAVTQQLDRWQRQDEVANGAAANDEDPIQLSIG